MTFIPKGYTENLKTEVSYFKEKENPTIKNTGKFLHNVYKSEKEIDSLISYSEKFVGTNTNKTIIIKLQKPKDVNKLPDLNYDNIINLSKVNDFSDINEAFIAINKKIIYNGILVGNVESFTNRKARILSKYPKRINKIYYFFDVLVSRYLVKFSICRKVHYFITGGKNKAISRTETLGRLYACGFEVIDETFINNRLYFAARKKSAPLFEEKKKYGLIIKLKRHGYKGKLFNVYKLRTMYPYSEYLQDYIFKKNNLEEGGKFKNDFRITPEGKIFRKFWIDEIPMLVNLLKGDIKLVGVRPLSEHYFSLYTDELKEKRKKHKPGLIPPYYVDLPKTLDEIMDSEKKYFEQYEKSPLITDIKYFFKIFYNIIVKKARSA